jgi:hypothetical protein
VGQARTKGKIHNSEWPSIVQRHVDGETIADIARSYHCTAPAIRYIVRRSAAAATETSSEAKGRHAPPAAERPETGKRWRAEMPTEAAVYPGSAGESAAGGSHQGEIPAPPRLGRDLVRKANGDIAAFIVALNAADTNLDAETAEELRDATDRLLQSCARTRLEIERIFPFSANDQPTRPSNKSLDSRDAGPRPNSSVRS